MNLASVDIGTNAVLLLVIRKHNEGLEEVLDESSITRLGEGLIRTGGLSASAMERTVLVLEKYRRIIDRHDAKIVTCFGTSALRESSNAHRFIDMAMERTGIDVRVFSEFEEAYYTYLSVRQDPAIQGQNLVIVDIGGGSTEIAQGNRESFLGYVSLPVGTVKLTERFIKHDPPLREELEDLGELVRGSIPPVKTVDDGGQTVIGMAGTMTTVASMVLGLDAFNKKKIHGCPITLTTLEAWIAKLGVMTIAERRTIPGMEPGREDLLLQGMILMREILRTCGSARFTVSAYGARYGVIFEAVGEERLQSVS